MNLTQQNVVVPQKLKEKAIMPACFSKAHARAARYLSEHKLIKQVHSSSIHDSPQMDTTESPQTDGRKQKRAVYTQRDSIIWHLEESGVAELFIEICFVNSATGTSSWPGDTQTSGHGALHGTYRCYPYLSPPEVPDQSLLSGDTSAQQQPFRP